MNLKNYILKKIGSISIGSDLISIRKILFEIIVVISCVLGLMAVIIGGIEVYLQGKWQFLFVYILAYLPVLGCFLFRKKIVFHYRVIIILFDFYILSVLILAGVGLSGAGISLLITFCVLATTFLGIKMGLVSVLLSFIGILIIGSGMSTGMVPIDIITMTNSTRIEAWLMASTLFLFIGSIMVVCPGILQSSLQKTIEIIQKKTLELQNSNKKLEQALKDKEKTEKELKKSEELFKLITENTSALVSIHDSEGNYLFASPSHEKLGYKPADLIGQSGFLMVEKEDIKVMLELLGKGRQGEISKSIINYRLKDKKGEIHYFRGSFDAVFNSDGFLERIIYVGEDISELRQAEADKMDALAEAAETKKLALVGQVAGKIAHDFNNILGVIMGNAEFSLLDCEDAGARKTFELIFEQTIRGKNLTKNLMVFAKDQEPKQEYFQINKKIELVLKLLKSDLDGINIIREYGDQGYELLADPGMIEHALVNIIQNSIHATSLVEHPEIIIQTSHHDDQICVEIEDNGCGIPQEFLKEILEPSFTLKGSKDRTDSYKKEIRGTGYGLSNVKKYVEQHKGHLVIESEFSEGTKVTIYLPFTKKELTKKELAVIDKEMACYEKYILLVEDEQEVSDVLYKILTRKPCNHKVDIASNGRIAIDLFSRNQYDFVSLDYILPGGLNGMDVYNHIRETNKTIPLLFLSGNIEFLESIKQLKQKDAYVDHLSKPCRNTDYVNAINNLAGKLKI